MLQNEHLLDALHRCVTLLTNAFRTGNKVLFCGNGGSAADAQHLAAELSGRFYLDREPLFAEALQVNTSFLTAVANDYHYDETFARMVRASGREGDVLILLSTSGNSPNILRAAEDARTIGLTTVGITGSDGGQLSKHCDLILRMPSSDTPRIQEASLLSGHIICELVEAELFGP